ncbi:MAG TPA: hypothetical protein VMX13_13945 [Sedimentisphaerales bacterium]|nr:hypothetical protein [Sedimentisphaerales bacterium]
MNVRFDTIDGEEVPAIESRAFWDGSLFFNRNKLQENGATNVAYFSRDESLRGVLMSYDSGCSFLDGLFPGGTQHVTSTMRKCSHLVLQEHLEEVDGVPCYVVQATGKYGQYKIWIDPTRGYNIRKAAMRKEVGDLFDDEKPLSADQTQFLEFTVHNIEVENVGGVWFPVGGRAEKHEVYKGKEYRYQYSAHRSNIVWNPDFEALGAFRIDLPEGAYIRNDQEPGVRYEWRAGRIRPYFDHVVMDYIDEQARLLLQTREKVSNKVGGRTSEKHTDSATKARAHPAISDKHEDAGDRSLETMPRSRAFLTSSRIVAIIAIALAMACCLFFSWRRRQI